MKTAIIVILVGIVLWDFWDYFHREAYFRRQYRKTSKDKDFNKKSK